MSDLLHIREVESVGQGRGQGQGAARDPVVVESWLRCLNSHGLDPAQRTAAHIVTDRELREHRQQSEDLIAIARSGIERLYSLVAGQNYVLLLADHAGVTVEYLGDEAQKAALRRGGLYLGAEWSEARAGTCAVGSCLQTGEALIIHQSDHFDISHTGLSCTAAPIYDSRGKLAAALDISLLSSPRPRASQSMALNLVQQTVRRVEMANLMAENRHDWVLRLAGSPDFLDVDPEAAVALDPTGRILGATHGAMRVLAEAAGLDWRRPEVLIGRKVSDFLEIRLDRLDDLTRDRPAAERLIETRDGHRLFAHAIEPRPAPSRPQRRHEERPKALPPVLRQLAGEDAQMEEILLRAAGVAPSRLPLLIEGATGTGKRRLAEAIHALSGRGPLLTLAAADLDDPEAEARFFGRLGGRRGDEPGLIAELAGGTLLLQNVEDLPERVQSRLSRLMAEGGYVPLGGLRSIPLDLRVIATSQSGANLLRPDFYHRLCGVALALPALGQRQDLIWLADRMIASAAGRRLDLPPELLRALTLRDWPGNLRELSYMAARLARLGEAGAIPLEPALAELGPLRKGPVSHLAEAAELAQILAASGGNISLCARKLGVDRTTVHRRMKRLGLDRAGTAT